MLEFWYSERCSREIKLVSSLVVCGAIYFCSSITQLAPLWVGFSLALGVLIHILFTQFLKLATSHPYRITLRNGIYIFQLFALLSLAYVLPEQHKWVLWLQCIGFHALGLFLVSIYSNRAKRHA